MFNYQRPLTNFKHASNASIFPLLDLSSRAFSQDRWTSDIKAADAGIGLTNRVYQSMRVLAPVITSASAPMALFRRDLVPRKMSSSCGIHRSVERLEVLTADVVGPWVASGDKYSGILEDVNIGGRYALPWIIHRGAAVVGLTGAGPCDPQEVETRTFETAFFTCRLFSVRERRPVPAAVLSSGIS